MKKSLVCLSLIGAFLLAVNLVFAQDQKANSQDEAQMSNTESNSDEIYVPENAQGNSDAVLMPFIPQDNSDNAVSGIGN